MSTNTPEENALEAWARSDKREIRPDALVRVGATEAREDMRNLINHATSKDTQETT